MKVFISWSGERSRRVAELLRTWIECVIQAVEPWVSSSDIDRGALWFTQIIDELSSTTHGIICLTRDNKEKPWILFEAGALAKGLASSRIYTLLVDLNPEDVRDPLAQFNHTRPTEGDMFKLVSSINKGLESKGLKESILRKSFDTYWSQFKNDFDTIISQTEEFAEPKIDRSQEDIMSEILNSVRGIDRRVRNIEARPNSSSERADIVKPLSPLSRPQTFVKLISVAVELMSSGYSNADAAALIIGSNSAYDPDMVMQAVEQAESSMRW